MKTVKCAKLNKWTPEERIDLIRHELVALGVDLMGSAQLEPVVEELRRMFMQLSELRGVVLKAHPPVCGHSACRQNWIDTGERLCVIEKGE